MSYKSIHLLDGRTIPQIAFGTGTALFGQNAAKSVLAALRAGFTHIDTAQAYQNEDSVGDGIGQSGISRDKIFVTTKLNRLGAGESVVQSLQGSLKKLKLEYVDLFLIHFPIPYEAPGVLEEVWQGVEECKDKGYAKSIGVSNFRIRDLERVLKVAKYKPVVNQIEFHPYLYKQLLPLLKLHEEEGIRTESYGGLTPLTRDKSGPVTPVLQSIAQRIGGGATEGQILLKWLEAKGIIAVTTTGKPERLEEYLATYKLPDLTPEDIAAIDEAGAKLHSRHFAQHMEQL